MNNKEIENIEFQATYLLFKQLANGGEILPLICISILDFINDKELNDEFKWCTIEKFIKVLLYDWKTK